MSDRMDSWGSGQARVSESKTRGWFGQTGSKQEQLPGQTDRQTGRQLISSDSGITLTAGKMNTYMDICNYPGLQDI